MEAFWLLGAACLMALMQHAAGFGSGAPQIACADMVPQHKVPPQKTPFPYIITVDKNSVKAGDKVKVTVSGKDGLNFKGFFIQARVGDVAMGQFEKGSGIRTVDCGSGLENAATHTDPKEKSKIEVIWKSPEKLTETVKFLVTVAKDGGTFWVAQPSDSVTVN